MDNTKNTKQISVTKEWINMEIRRYKNFCDLYTNEIKELNNICKKLEEVCFCDNRNRKFYANEIDKVYKKTNGTIKIKVGRNMHHITDEKEKKKYLLYENYVNEIKKTRKNLKDIELLIYKIRSDIIKEQIKEYFNYELSLIEEWDIDCSIYGKKEHEYTCKDIEEIVAREIQKIKNKRENIK